MPQSDEERPLLHQLFASLSSLRKSLRNFFATFILFSVAVFFFSPDALQEVQRHLGGKLYFFSVAGPFLAHVKLAIFIAVFVLVPWGVLLLWKILGKTFRVEQSQLNYFILFTCLLFYLGTIFCYFVTLPFGIKFLLGFGSEELKPVISVGRCINFVTIFVLAFGLVFELPIFMVFLVRVKLFSINFYKKNRRYAIFVIAVLAAILTPTPDVVNMALMGVPLYLLYEVGIVATSLVTKNIE